MAGLFFRFVSVCLLSFGALQTQAADFGSGKYDVYVGSINTDDVLDIYLHGKEQFVLLHGDILKLPSLTDTLKLNEKR